ncbi:MAG: hypothetical protein MK108_02250 [Mariniblastus sp.]|nr:hypothetical protein [Mariniblastus sp.]
MSDASFPENLISAYLDGELSPEESAHVERMLQQHPEYADLLEEFRQQSAALKQLPKLELDADFARRVMADDRIRATAPPAADRAVPANMGRERWVGAIAAIGALAATILVILLLPFLNPSATGPVAAKSSDQAERARPNAAAAAPPAAAAVDSFQADDLQEGGPEDAIMAKGDLLNSRSDREAGRGLEKPAQALNEDRSLKNDVEMSGRSRSRPMAAADRPAMPGKKEAFNQKSLALEDMELELEDMELDQELGSGDERVASDERGLLMEEQVESPGFSDSGGPFHSVNVMQIDLPQGAAERKRLFDLLDKYQVALPRTGESAPQQEGAADPTVDAASIYYVLADKTQMTGFAMDLSRSSSAVIAMYRMGEGNRQKIGQYLQSPPVMQQIQPEQSFRQDQQAGEDQSEEQAQQVAPVQQLDLPQPGQQSIGVPMDSIIVKGGNVIAGGSGKPQDQLSLSYLNRQAADTQQRGNQWFDKSPGGGQGLALREKAGELSASAGGGGGASAIEQKIDSLQTDEPASPNRQLQRPDDRSVQVYLLIVQSRQTPDTGGPAEPAAAGEKGPDQVPRSNQ